MQTKASILINNEPLLLNITQAQQFFPLHDLEKRLIDICCDTMEGLTQEHAGTPDQWIDVDKALPDNTRILIIDGQIVGYWFYVCLNDKAFETAKKGQLREEEITIDKVVIPKKPGDYKGYFAAIALRPQYKSFKNFKMLLDSFMDHLEGLAKNGVYITEWCANGYTSEGRALCKSMGLTYLCDNVADGKIYHTKFDSEFHVRFMKHYPSLDELYTNHLKGAALNGSKNSRNIQTLQGRPLPG